MHAACLMPKLGFLLMNIIIGVVMDSWIEIYHRPLENADCQYKISTSFTNFIRNACQLIPVSCIYRVRNTSRKTKNSNSSKVYCQPDYSFQIKSNWKEDVR